jgi:hypothetical protein
MGRVEVCADLWWERLRVRDHLEDPGIDGRIILRWIFRKWVVVEWTGSIWLRLGTGGELFLIGGESLGSMNWGIS